MRRGIEEFRPETVRLNLLRADIGSEVLEGLDRECLEGQEVRVIRREIIRPPVVTKFLRAEYHQEELFVIV